MQAAEHRLHEVAAVRALGPFGLADPEGDDDE
jgi:hypothetical protein